MLATLKLQNFRELVKDASKEEIIWMNGFLSALMPSGVTLNVPETQPAKNTALAGCTVVYGTETGNSKKVAVDFSARLKKQGVQMKMKSLDQYRITDLSKESCLLVVLSTQGDGEPPASAKKFYDHILQNDLSLSHLKYGVLALGDSAYPLFCKAGEDVDERLSALGAQRITPLCKCDADFETDAQQWMDQLLNTALNAAPKIENGSPAIINNSKPVRTGRKTYQGSVLTKINLNDTGSNKETYHLEIETDEAIQYEPGDSIGIIAKNNSASVSKLLDLLDLKPEQELEYKKEIFTAVNLFSNRINIQYLPERIVQQYAKLIAKEIPSMRMDLADLIRIYPFDQTVTIDQILAILDPIVPRLYSISSSSAAHGENEVHITVSRDRFTIDTHQRYGLCSDYLSSLNESDKLQIYVQKNSAFKLPAPDVDMIMIGPGTGIAPFRSFLFERDAQGAEGRNWLFFGDQHFVSDFLYQTELQAFFETGVLTKLNTAFSRDQAEKIYVQHRMKQQAEELYQWIKNGSQIYICGAKDPMSSDVENTLIEIISEQGGLNLQEATDYLNALHENGRYHKDVY